MYRWEDSSLLCGSWESRHLQYSWRILGLSQILANTTTSLFTVSSTLVSVCSLQITFLPTDDLLFPPLPVTLACPSPLGSTFMDSCKRKPKCPLHYVPSTLHCPWHSIVCSITKLTNEWSKGTSISVLCSVNAFAHSHRTFRYLTEEYVR